MLEEQSDQGFHCFAILSATLACGRESLKFKILYSKFSGCLKFCKNSICRNMYVFFVAVEERTWVSGTLPGSGEPIPSLEQRLSPRVDQDELEDEYGPALPPAGPSQLHTGIIRTSA